MRQNLFSEFMLPVRYNPLGAPPTAKQEFSKGKQMAQIGAVAVGVLLSKLYMGKSSIKSETRSTIDNAILPSSVLLVSGPAIQLVLGKDIPILTWLGVAGGCVYLLYKVGPHLFKVLRVATAKVG